MHRYICIHGHFYQPPRENPWLEEIETEDSAYPYHDWNERITAECYAPNASSRILDSKREILDIVNNYSRISFNFGPTLLSWMETHEPEVYNLILQADRESKKRFSGHGSAIAQIYNHIIMPLASSRDKQTEVIWGIRDFVSRFGRQPEGMWLSETAVDYETLDLLAQNGITFTILDPHQAKRVRIIGDVAGREVNEGDIDIGMPYLCRLPTGRTIAIFFYDHRITNEIAFGKLLDNGEVFANRMISTFPQGETNPRLLCIASDGETYGHHHRFADMALAYALHTIESKDLARITIPGEYLELHPPTHEVEIRENTSWSCEHGVERWRSDCGCRTYHACLISDPSSCVLPTPDTKPVYNPQNWNQKWRSPLRDAMNLLGTNLSDLYLRESTGFFSDPWQARDEYIDVILDRSGDNIAWFFSKNLSREGSPEEISKALKLLEMERNALLMFTSCGWFFDELSGIETVQVMMYACRAIQLAKEVSGTDYEQAFIMVLRHAVSNVPKLGTGADIYDTYVRTVIVDVSRVAFHYAITSLIEQYPEEVRLYTYTVSCDAYRQGEAGILKLVTGHASFRSELTYDETILTFAAIHIGEHNFMGGVRKYVSEEAFEVMEKDIWNAFTRSDVPGMVLSLNQQFEKHSFSLWDLFKDGRKKVLYSILTATLVDVESEYRQIYRRYFSLIRAMKEMQIKSPDALEYPVQYILNHDIIESLDADEPDLRHLKIAVEELIHGKYVADLIPISHIAGRCITGQIELIALDPEDIIRIEKVNTLFSFIKPLKLSLDLWDSQNQYFRISTALSDEMQQRAGRGDEEASEWIRSFTRLGANMGVRDLKSA